MSGIDDNAGDPAARPPGVPVSGKGEDVTKPAAPTPPRPAVPGARRPSAPGAPRPSAPGPPLGVPPARGPSVSTPEISTAEESFSGFLPPIDSSAEAATSIDWDDESNSDDEDEAPTLRPAESKPPPAPQAVTADGAAPAPGEDEEREDEEGEDEDGEYDAANDPYIGTTVGERYVVDEVLGEGGMGRVYLAHHKVIGKKMAIKILHAELARDKDAVRRFVREAKAASSIGNPHIVDISDFGETEDGSTYFVMEYLDGYALADMMEERGALPVAMVCDIALQLCDGLAAAHRQDIVHRDLKPENVTLVTQGTNDRFCKILDFGIAKVSTGQSATKITMAGAVFGTPHYMSPEQAAGAAVDHRTDIYSLGVILYEMAAGKLPFNADNFMGILTQHMYRAPVPIRALVGAPDCDPGMEALILKCLSKKPDARYQTMEDLAEDIRKYQADGVPLAVSEMMARSGSFNVPADYFKATSAALVPGSPQGPRKRLGPRYVALAGIAAAILIVVLVLMRDSTTTAETTSANPAASPPEPQPTAAQQTAEVSTPNEIAVLVYAEPTTAVAVIDGDEVNLPETFPVINGVDFNLEIRAEGYVSQQIVLDGTQAKVRIKLDKDVTKAGTRPRPHTPNRHTGKGKGSSGGKPKGGGDYVDPWSQNH